MRIVPVFGDNKMAPSMCSRDVIWEAGVDNIVDCLELVLYITVHGEITSRSE